MKPRSLFQSLLVFVVVCLFAGAPAAHAISLGDDRESVVEELGSPAGEVQAGEMTLLVYPRGEVRLRHGSVSAIDLVSEEELTARLSAEGEELERIQAARAERMARLEAEGREIHADKTSDPAFLRLAASEQLRFWRSFSSRYPMIPIDAELATLRDRIAQDNQLRALENATEDRIADLEARVVAAEDRAVEAERQANALHYFGSRSSRSSYYSRPPLVILNPRSRYPRGRDRDYDPDDRRPIPYADPMGEARAQAMGEYEASRARIYSGASP